MPIARAVLPVAVIVLLQAGSAQAATTVERWGDELRVQADVGRVNTISVTQPVVGGEVLVRDIGDTVQAWTGCVLVDSHTVSCSAAGVSNIRVRASDQRDKVYTSASVPATLEGGAGKDYLNAHSSSATSMLIGGADADALIGGRSDDVLQGGTGGDVLRGGPGRDRALYSERLAPVFVSLDGVANDGELNELDDVEIDVEDVSGGGGADVLVGSAADNRFTPGMGDDTVDGGDGDDEIWSFGVADGADSFDGGPGAADHMDYSQRTSAVVVDLNGLADDGAAGERDDVQATVENVTAGRGDDTVFGSAAANLLEGGAGTDFLVSRDGLANDAVDGGTGSDTCRRDPGDTITACEFA
jgi:Ca2+-binding RTX toxin-like protein